MSIDYLLIPTCIGIIFLTLKLTAGKNKKTNKFYQR